MRDYGKVSPRFWNGKTGKALRGDIEAQLLALYLITSPHANMIGVFHCPVMYMAHETGLSEEGALEALQRLIEAQFCTFEGVEELVWVHEMASFQIAPSLSPKDKQCVGIARQYEQIPDRLIRQGFYERYKDAFHLACCDETTPKKQAPSKPLRSQEQEQEQEQEEEEAYASVGKADPEAAPKRSPECPAQAIVDLYHQHMPDNPRCKLLNDARRGAIRARWKEAARLTCKPFGYANREDGLKAWGEFFAICADSEFLTGKRPGLQGKPPFIADLDFLISPSGFTRTLENKYHREAA